MNIETVQQKIADNENLLLLDIREASEVAQTGMIEHAINKPMGAVFVSAGKGQLPEDTEIVVYCASGTRGAVTTQFLQEKGYTAHNLEGGYKKWSESA